MDERPDPDRPAPYVRGEEGEEAMTATEKGLATKRANRERKRLASEEKAIETARAKIAKALGPFDCCARQRILNYVRDLYADPCGRRSQ